MTPPPAPTPSGAGPRARPTARSDAAWSATWPASSTDSWRPTPALTLHRWHVSGTPSARCGTLAASDRTAGARGGPDGHRRRTRHPPAADHLRLGRHRHRAGPSRADPARHPCRATGLACPAGGMSPRRSWAPGFAPIWRSRPTPGRCAAPSGGPRPTGPTPTTCVTCCCVGRCPSPGSRPPTSLTSAPRCGCAKRSWTSAPPGINASTPCCTTTACRNAPGCSPIRAAPG
jgi:hypothetical protein